MEVGRTIKKRLALLALGVALLVALWPQGVLKAEVTAIRAYQMVGSPVAGMTVLCRYQPTCSHYALMTLERDGLWKGNLLVLKRLLLCSPIGFVIDQMS